jgi:hypothetical protein
MELDGRRYQRIDDVNEAMPGDLAQMGHWRQVEIDEVERDDEGDVIRLLAGTCGYEVGELPIYMRGIRFLLRPEGELPSEPGLYRSAVMDETTLYLRSGDEWLAKRCNPWMLIEPDCGYFLHGSLSDAQLLNMLGGRELLPVKTEYANDKEATR